MTAEEQQLLDVFAALAPAQREMLLAFAAFLSTWDGAPAAAAQPVPEPQVAPRPAQESVVAAIQRLARGYPMLDKARMLHEVSGLMAQHVVQGRPAAEVIDEIELVFERHYGKLSTTEKS